MTSRNAITFEDKMKIFKDIDNGVKQIDVSRKYQISNSTISSFLKSRKSIEQMVKSGRINVKRKRVTDAVNKSIDTATIKWFNMKRAQNVKLNGPLIREKARNFASMLGIENFKASTGWLRSFKNRYGIAFKIVDGEEKPQLNRETAKQFNLRNIENIYDPDDIYTAVETGLFYRLLPEETLMCKNEICDSNNKSKDRLTILLCVNATGTYKVTPLVIGQSPKPRCFQNIKSLPVEYVANESALMTEEIFNGWLRSLDTTMGKRNKQIALIVNKYTAHSNPPKIENVHIYYVPPDYMLNLRPLNQGIVKCTKGYYRRNQIKKILFKLDNNVVEPFNVNIKQACNMIGNSWNIMKQSTIRNYWKRSGFSLVSNSAMECNDEATFQLGDDDLEEINCVESLEICLNTYQSTTGKNISINAEDYMKVDQELLIFGESTEKDIIADIIANSLMKGEENEKDNVAQVTNLTPVEAVLLMEKLHSFVSTLSNVPDQYFFDLESLTNICMNAGVK